MDFQDSWCMDHVYVNFGDARCIGFWDIVWETHKQTDKHTTSLPYKQSNHHFQHKYVQIGLVFSTLSRYLSTSTSIEYRVQSTAADGRTLLWSLLTSDVSWSSCAFIRPVSVLTRSIATLSLVVSSVMAVWPARNDPASWRTCSMSRLISSHSALRSPSPCLSCLTVCSSDTSVPLDNDIPSSPTSTTTTSTIHSAKPLTSITLPLHEIPMTTFNNNSKQSSEQKKILVSNALTRGRIDHFLSVVT